MKKFSFIFILLLAGCVSSQNETSHSNGNGIELPTVPVPKLHKHVVLMSPKAAAEAQALPHAIVRSGPTPTVPRWAFVRMPTNTFGNWQIEATSNLTSGVWFPVAVVYGATNIVLTSDTVTKRGSLFYRVKQVK